jgi:hypothetical protein
LGAIFAPELAAYSHWAFGDMDVLMGDLSRHLHLRNDLDRFDVISLSFGDQFRGYPRCLHARGSQSTLSCAVKVVWTMIRLVCGVTRAPFD